MDMSHPMHTPNMARQRISEVREAGKLPADGRESEPVLKAFEDILLDVFAPDIPTYDVNPVQGTGFDEWTYTEGLGCFFVKTQSAEINARLMLLAVEVERPDIHNPGPHHRIAGTLPDKWKNIRSRDGRYTAELAPRAVPAVPLEVIDPLEAEFRDLEVQAGKRDPLAPASLWTFFPPGDNILKQIVNIDNVLRAFDTDQRWRMKPHPITTLKAVDDMRRTFGAPRIYSRRASGMDILRQSAVVGYTTSSEMGLMALLLDRKVVDFTLYEQEHRGCYHPIYKALRDTPVVPKTALGRIMECPWSGMIPLDTPHDEVAQRLRAYKRTTIELRDTFRPVVVRGMGAR